MKGTVQSGEKVFERGCEKFLPGPAWLLLSKTYKDFFSTLYTTYKDFFSALYSPPSSYFPQSHHFSKEVSGDGCADVFHVFSAVCFIIQVGLNSQLVCDCVLFDNQCHAYLPILTLTYACPSPPIQCPAAEPSPVVRARARADLPRGAHYQITCLTGSSPSHWRQFVRPRRRYAHRRTGYAIGPKQAKLWVPLPTPPAPLSGPPLTDDHTGSPRVLSNFLGKTCKHFEA